LRLERIGLALENCGDRVTWAMSKAELTVLVHQAQQSGAPEQQLLKWWTQQGTHLVQRPPPVRLEDIHRMSDIAAD
jgi:hypothetical protein